MTHHEIVPPWLKYPKCKGIFWRMGAGEDCIIKFREFYSSMCASEKTNYKEQYPAPAGLGWELIYRES